MHVAPVNSKFIYTQTERKHIGRKRASEKGSERSRKVARGRCKKIGNERAQTHIAMDPLVNIYNLNWSLSHYCPL